jgi:hypothetical protein
MRAVLEVPVALACLEHDFDVRSVEVEDGVDQTRPRLPLRVVRGFVEPRGKEGNVVWDGQVLLGEREIAGAYVACDDVRQQVVK